MLNLKDINISYDKNKVIEDVSIHVKKGDMISIIGRNGSGKSTILKSMINLLKIDSGLITFEQKDVKKYKTKLLARKIAYVAQQKSTYPDLSVETLISYGRYPHMKLGKSFDDHDRKVIKDALCKTGLYELREKSIKKLSGGERQRAWIAMALCQEPEISILDEPTTYLDVAYQIEVLDLVKSLNETLGMNIIMFLHDINLAARYSKSIYAIKDKKVYAYGSPHEIVCPKVLGAVFTIEGNFYKDEEDKCPFFIPKKSKYKEETQK